MTFLKLYADKDRTEDSSTTMTTSQVMHCPNLGIEALFDE